MYQPVQSQVIRDNINRFVSHLRNAQMQDVEVCTSFFVFFFLAGLNKLQKLFFTFLQFDWFLLTSNWLLNFSKASSLAEKKM